LARFGLILAIVADNRPPFGSSEFQTFLQENGVTLMHSPPYHPESNGLLERAIQKCKNSLKKINFGQLLRNT
jgi:transposase InsO family protein